MHSFLFIKKLLDKTIDIKKQVGKIRSLDLVIPDDGFYALDKVLVVAILFPASIGKIIHTIDLFLWKIHYQLDMGF